MLLKPDHCKSCVGWGWSQKEYVPASGTGENGVLILAEAAGEHETKEGMPLVGMAGSFLFKNLLRAGIEREGFRVHNILSCRPPENKLAGMPYEDDAINHCSPLLNATIEDMRERCNKNGKTFTIITLGKIAFKKVMGFTEKSPEMGVDYLCYPFWSDRYRCWVIAADHPSYLMRGNSHLIPMLQFAFSRALEIAANGFEFHKPNYLRDPSPQTFAQWVRDYLAYLKDHPDTYLAFDIETPHKQGADEEEVAREDDDDYSILRCSFSYIPGEAVSVPWRAEYLPYLEELFASNGDKLAHNANYDVPRIVVQIPIKGRILDNMVAWHVLNSALRKSLGLITPFYAQNMPLWKHLSKQDPAGYNCQDSDATLRDFLGIKADLIANGQWHVFERHVVLLDEALSYMSGKGVLRDETMRKDAEKKLQDLLDVVEINMQASVPVEARKLKVYKKTPKSVEGLVQTPSALSSKVCLKCGELKPRKNHSIRCDGERGKFEWPTLLWAKPLDFKISKVGLSSYQKALRHQAIISRREKKITFDETAIIKLIKQYPMDPLYPKILEHREYQKLLSTYIGVTLVDGSIRGGMPIGRDGRIHTLFTHNPSTLRLASQQPNLQNLPRPSKDPNALGNIIRNLIIAGDDRIFTARDYSGIEAVLVGYFALSPRYIRLSKIDVHSFYTAWALHELDGRVASADLPDFGWSDERLIPHLAGIKKEFSADRNSLYKHLVHGANFMQGAAGAREKILRETGVEFPLKKIRAVMDVYFNLFPEIRRWHSSLMLQAERDGFLKNPFGYVHRFYHVYKYKKEFGKWTKDPGDDANKVIAFLPQSTAAGIIKEAILRLFFKRFNEAGQYLRLQVHDEVFCEVPEALIRGVDKVMQEEMERPIPELPLPASYGMGKELVILTEGKSGKRWGGMH